MDKIKEMRRYGIIEAYDEIIDQKGNAIRIEIISYNDEIYYFSSCNGKLIQQIKIR